MLIGLSPLSDSCAPNFIAKTATNLAREEALEIQGEITQQ